VHYHIGAVSKVDTVAAVPDERCANPSCRDPLMGWGYWGVPESTLREEAYTEGTLMLDVVQRATGRLAWRATGVREAVELTTTEEVIRQAVSRLLRDFPVDR